MAGCGRELGMLGNFGGIILLGCRRQKGCVQGGPGGREEPPRVVAMSRTVAVAFLSCSGCSDSERFGLAV